MDAATKTRKISRSKEDCGCGSVRGCEGADILSLKRPRFFAGQLLTEEDLELLSAYVVGKNRLHNRFLFGEGVVCGLTVTCHPCGGGSVLVSPGYALDCCGNDIYVPCNEEIDINALVHELRVKMLAGYDCGDPCAEPKNDDSERDDAVRRYCLYIRHVETQTDPVAPYAAHEPCGQVSCQGSRICEGYKFELRCDDERAKPEDVLDRISDCIGDLTAAAANFRKAQTTQAYALQAVPAVDAIHREKPLEFDADDIEALQVYGARLKRFAAEVKPEGGGEEGAEAEPPAKDEASFRRAISDYQIVTSAIARFGALDGEKRGTVLAEFPNAEALVEESKATTSSAASELGKLAPKSIEDPFSREVALNVVELGQRYTRADLKPEELQTAQGQLFVRNAPIQAAILQRSSLVVSSLKEWLLDRLESSASLTSCDLRDRVLSIKAPGDVGDDFNTADVSQLARATIALVYALMEYLKDCFCLALNPACPPCDDPVVLLACLKVKECEVIDICNLDRTFVLSPVALRYWVPPLSWLGESFERFCCEFDFRPDKPVTDLVRARVDPEQGYMVKSYTPRFKADDLDDDELDVVEKSGIGLADVSNLASLSANLSKTAVRTPALQRLPATLKVAGRGITRRVDTPKLFGAAIESPAGRAALDRTVISSLRDPAGPLRAAVLEEFETVRVRSAEVVRDEVIRALGPENLKGAIEASDALAQLKEENQGLRDDLGKLAKTIEDLENRIPKPRPKRS